MLYRKSLRFFSFSICFNILSYAYTVFCALHLVCAASAVSFSCISSIAAAIYQGQQHLPLHVLESYRNLQNA